MSFLPSIVSLGISSEMGNLKIIVENEVQGTPTVRRKLGVLPDEYQLRNGTYAG